MKLIAGLGNPGAEYAGTRHNIGFEVIDRIAELHNIPVRKRDMRAVLGDGLVRGEKVILVKPMTYMNLSGESVGAIARRYKLDPQDVWIIADDVALPLGRLRIRLKGSAGGHNGLTSIEQHLQTQEYPRFRVGVGAARGDMVGHVLGKFRPGEREKMGEAVDRAVAALEVAIEGGLELSMNRFNPDPDAPPKPPKGPKPEKATPEASVTMLSSQPYLDDESPS
jgi:PTH1 family peptidyl-tRNA hydrolase